MFRFSCFACRPCCFSLQGRHLHYFQKSNAGTPAAPRCMRRWVWMRPSISSSHGLPLCSLSLTPSHPPPPSRPSPPATHPHLWPLSHLVSTLSPV
ncbi:hypothetical protein E2C01_045337 [Portunus trituberculatus]|uniref:Uncharacterized protein n=1 Tax=Portunus trituberculatus TaxID=210409 RepID=A0A5B7FVH7_PORTR|nr:hypothetical protein [Portunus trituberculatus]